jgi:hypothetical protein
MRNESLSVLLTIKLLTMRAMVSPGVDASRYRQLRIAYALARDENGTAICGYHRQPLNELAVHGDQPNLSAVVRLSARIGPLLGLDMSHGMKKVQQLFGPIAAPAADTAATMQQISQDQPAHKTPAETQPLRAQ